MNGPATKEQRVDLLLAFTERAWARGYLYAIGEYDLAEAVDGLWRDAERDGLIELVGADALQKILAAAFAPFREGEL